MDQLTAVQIAELAEAELFCGPGDVSVNHVVRDSGDAVPGSLFIGLVGERTDGNRYAVQAYENGSRIFLLSDRSVAETFRTSCPDAAVLLAGDTKKSMQIFAKHYLEKYYPGFRIGVTGSSGKTSTRDILYGILSSRYRTVRNYKNYNNDIGVPLTAFHVEGTTEAAVFEMGMNHFHEIELLADIVRPQIGIITNVGTAHIENLGSQDGIRKAKLEITTFFQEDQVLVYNADDAYLADLKEQPVRYQLLPAGQNAGADGVILSDVDVRGRDGIRFALTYKGECVECHMPVLGKHNAWNAAVAAGAALQCGVTLEEITQALRNVDIGGNRLRCRECGSLMIIDDTYNANPDSAKAAIDALMSVDAERRVLILADMKELGSRSAELHREVGRYAGTCAPDLVLTIGADAAGIAAGAAELLPGERVHAFRDKPEFFAEAERWIRKGDTILLKGSHSTGMDEVVKYFEKTGESV